MMHGTLVLEWGNRQQGGHWAPTYYSQMDFNTF